MDIIELKEKFFKDLTATSYPGDSGPGGNTPTEAVFEYESPSEVWDWIEKVIQEVIEQASPTFTLTATTSESTRNIPAELEKKMKQIEQAINEVVRGTHITQQEKSKYTAFTNLVLTSLLRSGFSF